VCVCLHVRVCARVYVCDAFVCVLACMRVSRHVHAVYGGTPGC